MPHLSPLSQVSFRHAPRKITHFAKQRLSLSKADGSAGIHHVKGVRTLDDIVIGRQYQPPLQSQVGFSFKQLEHLAHACHIGNFIVICGMFPLSHLVNVAVRAFFIPANLFKITHTLQGHGDAFQAISNFN